MALDCRPPSPLFVIMLIDFSARVLLVGLKAPLDRLRPDDSILAAIRIFERFDNEASRIPWIALLATLESGAP